MRISKEDSRALTPFSQVDNPIIHRRGTDMPMSAKENGKHIVNLGLLLRMKLSILVQVVPVITTKLLEKGLFLTLIGVISELLRNSPGVLATGKSNLCWMQELISLRTVSPFKIISEHLMTQQN